MPESLSDLIKMVEGAIRYVAHPYTSMRCRPSNICGRYLVYFPQKYRHIQSNKKLAEIRE